MAAQRCAGLRRKMPVSPTPKNDLKSAPKRSFRGSFHVAALDRARHDFGMEIGGHRFEHVGDIQPERNDDGSLREYMPQSKYVNARQLPLKRYGAGPFCKFKIPNRLALSGVYILTIDGEVRYVGECANLSARFNAGYGNISPKNCFKGGQETNCRLNNLIYHAACTRQSISLWFLQTADYKVIEAAIRAALRLAWNRV
jgi:hypothetical protein